MTCSLKRSLCSTVSANTPLDRQNNSSPQTNFHRLYNVKNGFTIICRVVLHPKKNSIQFNLILRMEFLWSSKHLELLPFNTDHQMHAGILFHQFFCLTPLPQCRRVVFFGIVQLMSTMFRNMEQSRGDCEV